jgi:uncharacterized protein YutE (UPF0331/DUF86 family)
LTDPVLVSKRLAKLREYVQLLRLLSKRPRAEFISDPFVYGNVERYLQLAIQVILDISTHIVTDDRLGLIEEYRDALKLLGEKGILPTALAERLIPLAGLRNILVHDYLEVDRNRLFDALQTELVDFEEFASQIGRLL